jgi:hypothetical protein
MISSAELEADLVGRRTTIAYAHACDRKDRIALEAVFTADAVLHRGDGAVEGRQAILAFYDAFFASDAGHTRHFLCNQVTAMSGDDIRVESAFQFLYVKPEGLLLGWGDYIDVISMADGAPRIREKTITVHARLPVEVGGLDDVLRRPPWI